MCGLVSIVMPTYNAERYLKDAIDSILAQTYSDWELLVVDDDSSDKTRAVLEEYVRKDNRIKVIDGPKRGIAAALNYGISCACSKYIARMDADDMAMPKRIEKQVEYMENNPETGLCGTYYTALLENGKQAEPVFPTENEEIQSALLFSNVINHSSVIMRSSVLKQGFYYDEKVKAAEDYELWLRMIPKVKFHNLSERLMKYRVTRKSLSHANRDIVCKAAIGYSKTAISRLFLMDLLEYQDKIFCNTAAFGDAEIDSYQYLLEQMDLFCRMAHRNEKLKIFQQSTLIKAMQERWVKLLWHFGMNVDFLARLEAEEMSDVCTFLNDKELLKKYINKIEYAISELLAGNNRYAIYGMGICGKRVLGIFLNKKKQAVLFDKQVKEVEVNGETFTVRKPARLAADEFDCVLLASDHYYEEIKKELLSLGVEERKILPGNMAVMIRKTGY